MNREKQRICIDGCRYNERRNSKTEGSEIPHIGWLLGQTFSKTYEYRCDERLKHKSTRSRLLTHTGFRGGLVHLKIETRLIDG